MSSFAAVLVAAALWLAWPADRRARQARILGLSGDARVRVAVGRSARRETAVALLAGAAAAALIEGIIGLAVGCAAALLVHRSLARLEPAEVRLERERLAADLPLVASLLAAVVQAGASVSGAAESVGYAVGGPLGRRLLDCAAASAVGAAPDQAWQPLTDEPAVARLGRTIVRSETTGTSPARALTALSADAAGAARWAAQARVRSLGPRAALPLGLCFLPAFVVVGVVPFVASAAVAVLP